MVDYVEPQARDIIQGSAPSHLYYPGVTVADVEGRTLAQTHKDDGPDETLRVLREALESEPRWKARIDARTVYDHDDPEQVELLGLDRRFGGMSPAQRAEAIPRLEQFLADHPEPEHPAGPLARVLLGEARYNAGDVAGAEEAWREVKRLYPEHPMRHRAYYLLLDRETWPVAEHPHVVGAPLPPVREVTVPDPGRRAANLERVRGDSAVRWSPSGLPFVHVAPGTFTMGGSPAVHENEKPTRRVTLSQGFWLAAWTVTRALYRRFDPERWPGADAGTLAGELPATRLSYHDALAFIQWLREQDGLPYRLPTEAELEYAMRGGLEGKAHPWGDAPPDPTRCNYLGPRPVPVASYAPNGYGLFDAVGNTFEWTADRYSPEAFSLTPAEVTDPKGPSEDQAPLELYTVRASGCGSPFAAVLARTGWRVGFDADRRDGASGLRLCLSVDPGGAAPS